MEKKVKPEHEAVEALNREFAIKNARDAAKYGPPKYAPLEPGPGETRVLAGSLAFPVDNFTQGEDDSYSPHQDRARLENEIQMFRTVEEIARVQKKAKRYRKDAERRRVLAGEGEDERVEWGNGFEIIENLHAILAHPKLFASVGINELQLGRFTVGLRNVKRIKNADPDYPDIVPSLEKLGVFDCPGSVFDGGSPGGNGYFFKVYVNAARYEAVVDELWILRDRLADFIKRRVLDWEQPVLGNSEGETLI
jgi:hypothetical protein